MLKMYPATKQKKANGGNPLGNFIKPFCKCLWDLYSVSIYELKEKYYPTKCGCMCVCVRERDRKKEIEKEKEKEKERDYKKLESLQSYYFHRSKQASSS